MSKFLTICDLGRRKLSSLKQDEAGNFATTFALCLVPILFMIGASFDIGRLSQTQSSLQDAADNAALAGAIAYMQADEKEMREQGEKTFTINTMSADGLNVKSVNVTKNEKGEVEVTVEANLEPLFAKVLDFPKMDVNVTSKASVANRIGAEVAFAMDTTNSMAFGSSWNDSMGTIEKILEDMKSFSGDDNFYLTFVPFQDRVNLGKSYKSWMNKTVDWDDWDGCVEPRHETKGKFKWMLSNDLPNTQKFDTTDEDAEMDDGRDIACPKTELVAPTTDIDDVIKETKKLKTNGTGRFDIGLAWAWRSLSPEWRGQWGNKKYPSLALPTDGNYKKNETYRKKYIIFMTDGRSNAYKYEAMKQEDWGWNNGNKLAFEHIEQLCTDIKNDGIEIYMLHIPGNPNSTPYFKSCASSKDHYYVVDNVKDIPFAFEDIKASLYSQVRLLH
jgi:Flp pilus assembly protein TadG